MDMQKVSNFLLEQVKKMAILFYACYSVQVIENKTRKEVLILGLHVAFADLVLRTRTRAPRELCICSI